MLMLYGFCLLNCLLVSGHILHHQVSPSHLWSASISLSIYCHLKYLSGSLLFIPPRGRSAPVTPGLRPGYDLPATEKWANRRKNVRLVAEVVRLVAEVVGDRHGQISRNKVVVIFKTQSHRAYDQVTTYLRSKNVVMMGQS